MMKLPDLRLPLFAFSLLALNACNKSDTEELHSGVLRNNMDTLVKPGDNFTAYVNGAWMKKTKIPADKSGYGVWDIINDKAEEDVKVIIEEAAKGDFKDGSNEQKIGDFYSSYMDTKSRDAKGVKPLLPELAEVDAISNYNDLAAYFGKANRTGIRIPFAVGVMEDFKDPTKYMLFTWQGGLGLPEREYYFLTDEKSKGIREKYVQHIGKMLQLAGLPDSEKKAVSIMALETALASKHMKKEDTRNMVALYNKYAIKDLNKLAADFNWNTMLESAGIKNQDSLVVTQVEYTKGLNNIIKNTPIDTWKDYLKWGLVNDASNALTTALDQQDFEFYQKTLSGKLEREAMWKRAVNAVNGSLGEVIGEVYVKKHFKPEAKKRMEELVQNLLKAYEESIKGLDWMTPDTKKEALKKLKKFTPKIGYPDKWRDYTALKVVKGDLYGNFQRAKEFEYNRQINKLGKPVDRDEWGMTPQTVNAYYNPTLNEIVFPAAILQPPFFDMNAEDAVNYGGIGAVIGHEIGHGFDDQGSTFDGDGVMRNWWSEKDLAAFKQRTGTLVAQYNEFAVFPDLKVNGEFTLGENIGDLGGLSIALKAYKMSLKGKEAPVMDGFTGEQRVFIGWGQVWMSKDREEALRNQVASDPHSPSKFRVNGIVRNIPEFYSAFKIKPTDSLYLAPEKRVRIW
ncbi:MAG TPA: M13 family metallopeptidase [Flavobacterium sp.]|jgi:putative endopeptidase